MALLAYDGVPFVLVMIRHRSFFIGCATGNPWRKMPGGGSNDNNHERRDHQFFGAAAVGESLRNST